MNYLLQQLIERLDRMTDGGETEGKIRTQRLLIAEVLCRLAAALAIDEVTRPDCAQYMDVNKYRLGQQLVQWFFRINRVENGVIHETLLNMGFPQIQDDPYRALARQCFDPKTMGKYLSVASGLLRLFPRNGSLPPELPWLREFVSSLWDANFLSLRNIEAHEYRDNELLTAMVNVIRNLPQQYANNPYWGSDVSIGVLNNSRTEEGERPIRWFNNSSLQYYSPAQLARQANGAAPNADVDVMRGIALDENQRAVFMLVNVEGQQRLHLLSPLFACLNYADGKLGIFSRRQSSDGTSSYISLNYEAGRDPNLTWSSAYGMVINDVRHLTVLRWEGRLIQQESAPGGGRLCDRKTVTFGGRYPNHVFRVNALHDRRDKVYSEFYDAVYGDSFFDVPFSSQATNIERLYEMFRPGTPEWNPCFVSGRGGVGKTHTVLNALHHQFIRYTNVEAPERFNTVLFLSAKRMILNPRAQADASAVESRNWTLETSCDGYSDCMSAIIKLYYLLRDEEIPRNAFLPRGDQEQEALEVYKSGIIERIAGEQGHYSVLLILDDLDSVVSPLTQEGDTEDQRRQKNRDEQSRLVTVIRQLITATSGRLRVIITSRYATDQNSEIVLKTLNPGQDLMFAQQYYTHYYHGGELSDDCRELVRQRGEGVPILIMRIIAIYYHTSPALLPAALERLRNDTFSFSLNTTLLSDDAKAVLRIICAFNGVFNVASDGDQLNGLQKEILRTVFFNQDDEDFQHALEELQRWSMVSISTSGHVTRICVQGEALMLWAEQDDHGLESVVPNLNRKVFHCFHALSGELIHFDLTPVDTMNHILSKLDRELSDREKDQFARRVQAMILHPEAGPGGFYGSLGQTTRQLPLLDRWIIPEQPVDAAPAAAAQPQPAAQPSPWEQMLGPLLNELERQDNLLAANQSIQRLIDTLKSLVPYQQQDESFQRFCRRFVEIAAKKIKQFQSHGNQTVTTNLRYFADACDQAFRSQPYCLDLLEGILDD